MRKNQRPNQVNDPWYIPVVLLVEKRMRAWGHVTGRLSLEWGSPFLYREGNHNFYSEF